MKLGKVPPGAANEDLPEWAKASSWVVSRNPKGIVAAEVERYLSEQRNKSRLVKLRRSGQTIDQAVSLDVFEPYEIVPETLAQKRSRAGLASGEVRQRIPDIVRELADEFCSATGVGRDERGLSTVVRRILLEQKGMVRSIKQIRRDLLATKTDMNTSEK